MITDLVDQVNPGRLLAIRCDFKQGGKHGLTAYAPVGIFPGSFTISTDGKKVLLANKGNVEESKKPSLQLLDRDPVSGKLKLLSTLDYEGLSPESVQFSEDLNTIAVLNFKVIDQEEGSIDFFQIEGNQLVAKPDLSISVQKGAHAMIIVEN